MCTLNIKWYRTVPQWMESTVESAMDAFSDILNSDIPLPLKCNVVKQTI